MSPCLILLGFLFLILEEKGAISSSTELRKHDAKLSFLTSKLETMQLEIRLMKEDFQEEIKKLGEKLDQERQINAQILEHLNSSFELNIKEAETSAGETCSCQEIAILRHALQEIGDNVRNVSRRIIVLEENEKQKGKFQESGKMLVSGKIESTFHGFAKEKLARKKLEAEINLKFLSTENILSKISEECQSHHPKFNETMISQQRMNDSLRSLTVQMDGIQSSLWVLRNGQDKLFSTSDQLNGSFHSLSLEMNGIKSSLKILKDAQEQLSSKSDEMSRLLANSSSHMKNSNTISQKDKEISKIKLKLLEAGIYCTGLITEGEEILKSLKVGSRVVHGRDWMGGNKDERPTIIGTVMSFQGLPGWVYVFWDRGEFNAHRVGVNDKYDLYICE